MNALLQHLIARIELEGPLNMATYMAECLLHPTLGYYMCRDPLGVAGDFTTAPEISQMFGELMGLCLAQAWMDQGAPNSPVIAELGPGRGTLMADAVRAMRAVPGLRPDVHLVEASPKLRAAQAALLCDAKPTWHDTVETLPRDRPLLLVANEFFDALPIRQFQRLQQGWNEVVIATDGQKLMRARVPSNVPGRPDARPGDIVELCPAAEPIVAEFAQRIAHQGGAAVIIDYGDWRSLGDTVQGVKDHAPVDILASPGEADLTAHVDFEALAQAAQDLRVSTLTPQGPLLERLGITARAQALAEGLGAEALEAHIAAHRRLTHPAEMGSLFKAIALVPKNAPLPPGFDA